MLWLDTVITHPRCQKTYLHHCLLDLFSFATYKDHYVKHSLIVIQVILFVGTLTTRLPHKPNYGPFQGPVQHLHKPTERSFSGPKSNPFQGPKAALFRASLSGPDQSQVSLFWPIIGQFIRTNPRRHTNPADWMKKRLCGPEKSVFLLIRQITR